MLNVLLLIWAHNLSNLCFLLVKHPDQSYNLEEVGILDGIQFSNLKDIKKLMLNSINKSKIKYPIDSEQLIRWENISINNLLTKKNKKFNDEVKENLTIMEYQ